MGCCMELYMMILRNWFVLVQMIHHKQTVLPIFFSIRPCCSLQMKYNTQAFRVSASLSYRAIHKYCPAVCAVSSGVKDPGVSSSQFEDFSVTATSTGNAKELKISVELSGVKTRTIFDNVFSKMVADAQPIPGFRRVKGGKPFKFNTFLLHVFFSSTSKFLTFFTCFLPLASLSLTNGWGLSGKTPDIPRDILLEVLGPSKVYMQVIKKVINSTVAEYVEKVDGIEIHFGDVKNFNNLFQNAMDLPLLLRENAFLQLGVLVGNQTETQMDFNPDRVFFVEMLQEGIKVSKDLRVEQSFEDLEDAFEPGEEFRFDAVVQLQEMV
ncbi:hypothetical protein CK203_092992 [Vitis vinifera]|uniref:Trigger factor ribosome-binding bacterial domain-containing protein n=1 Tax=Vitis vinifera TaxID=29760 RepID=A0A438DFN3_VITVI|nr:hypothetical protein CK203_092992 [Vitis vinifera]